MFVVVPHEASYIITSLKMIINEYVVTIQSYFQQVLFATFVAPASQQLSHQVRRKKLAVVKTSPQPCQLAPMKPHNQVSPRAQNSKPQLHVKFLDDHVVTMSKLQAFQTLQKPLEQRWE